MKVLANKAAAKLIYGLIAAFLLLGLVPQPGNAFDPSNTCIVFVNGSGYYYPNITDAVGESADGWTILIYPGTYTDTDLEIDYRLKFIGIGEVKWSAADTLFVLGTDDVSFEGISFTVTGDAGLADIGSYRYVMKNCTLRCNNFDFGQGDSRWIGCSLIPKSQEGWKVSGGNTEVQLRNCKIGDDMPSMAEDHKGLNITVSGHLAAYYSNFYTDSTTFYLNDGKISLFYCMVGGGKGASIVAEGESTVSAMYSTFEGNDATGAIPAISLEESTFGHFNNCSIRNFPPTEDIYNSLYTQTTDSVILIDNNFRGTIELDQPSPAASGDIRFYGSNSIVVGGIDDESGGKRYGNAIKMHAYGESSFSGTSDNTTVTVNGMPRYATVTITYKHTSAVQSGDAVFAVRVNPDGEQFTLYRSSTNNTSNLYFYWSADWEQDQPVE